MNTENETFDTQTGTTPPTPPIPPRAYSPPPPLSPGDERLWAALAHLSILLNLITGFLGVAAALLIYLIYKERSRYVAYQALQAFLFQLIFWAGAGTIIGIMWAIVGVLSAIVIGIILIPFALVATVLLAVMPLGALIYGVIGALQCSDGQNFRYWLVGDWALQYIS
ncbi:MAG: DUF4870 domain-containing protein [Chloroflexota bacterium]|nr:DUF4870 domain-containing protein [Chloroflexota bacterium]